VDLEENGFNAQFLGLMADTGIRFLSIERERERGSNTGLRIERDWK
jgi:hypothetical protein